METFQEMIERRERESREFYERYANDPEQLSADLEKAISSINKCGYIVKAEENLEFGKVNEKRPVVYSIMHSDWSIVYGFGSCDDEQVIRFAAEHCGRSAEDETDGKTSETKFAHPDQEKEKKCDLVYNEGEEGYNPYRMGSIPTYKPQKKQVEEETI